MTCIVYFGNGAFLLRSGQPGRFLARLAAAFLALFLTFPSLTEGGPAIPYTFSPALPPAVGAPPTNSDGLGPASRMVLANDGNFYGTTLHGGVYGAGSIFRFTLPGTVSNLFSFPPVTNLAGAVNYNILPNDLMQAQDGNLYGTTRAGGTNFTGTIFQISLSGAFVRLHNFAAQVNNGSGYASSADGATPVGALVQGSDDNLYGTTEYGGVDGLGTIFRISPGGVFSNLYSFVAPAPGLNTSNGAIPNALMVGADGNFYGTTEQGGALNLGTFFKYSLTSGFAQILAFNDLAGAVSPNSKLVQDGNGNFYGTSALGGSQAGGAIFEITNNSILTVASFPQVDAGANDTLILAGNGSFYGMCSATGLNGNGSVFIMTSNSGVATYSFSALGANSRNSDGANPAGGLTEDDSGNLYGSCAAGGTNGSGVIFEISESNFYPVHFVSGPSNTIPLTNMLIGSSATISYGAQGYAPVEYQWLFNGTNLADGGALSGVTTPALTISPVLSSNVGSYSLVISNIWGPLTSSISPLTVQLPGLGITAPKPYATITSSNFSGLATNAPLAAGAASNYTRLAAVTYTISNLFNGSNLTGIASISAATNNVSRWSFATNVFPGTNILSVQSVDVSGDLSPVVSQTFFYPGPTALTLLKTGSGGGTFSITNHTITNGALLNLGESYEITAKPIDSTFGGWSVNGVITYAPGLVFVMQTNLTITANFMAKKLPAITILSPKNKLRTNSFVFNGTATTSPLLPGGNPTNIALTNVEFWLTNIVSQSNINNFAVLTNNVTNAPYVSNWFILLTNLPGTNTPAIVDMTNGPQPLYPGTNLLIVQTEDVSGAFSRLVTNTFFYQVQSLFSLTNGGNGAGAITGTSVRKGDIPPTNGAWLDLGQNYNLVAKPARFSLFADWSVGSTVISTNAALTFTMSSNLSLTANFIQAAPMVTIESPTKNQRTATPVFSGTAYGHNAISNVYWITDITNGIATLTSGTGVRSNWSFSNAVAPGTNSFTVYCIDVNSNVSTNASRTFFYKVPASLTVTNTGSGHGAFKGSASVADDPRPANGAMLNIGENYTITAVPDKNSLFSNWVQTAGTNILLTNGTASITFTMQSNLVLTAMFVSNFYPAATGIYNGLFYPTNGASQGNAGMVKNLTVRPSGAFSGVLLTQGTNYPFTGAFDASSNAFFAAGPFQANLYMNTAIPEITGTFGSAEMVADIATTNPPPSAQYTLLFTPLPSTNVSPPGDGYCLLTNHEGMVALSGQLADGTHFSQSAPISQFGELPLYASLYPKAAAGQRGLLLGWINLTNLQAAPPINILTWIKQQQQYATPFLYTSGFTNVLATQGAVWSNDAPPVSITNGQLLAIDTSLALDFTNVSVNNNQLENAGGSPTNSLAGTINPRTGLMTVIFGNGKRRETDTGYGVILQNTTNGGGFFLTLTNAGSVRLYP